MRIGDDERLRQVLIAAKKAPKRSQLAQLPHLIGALQESMQGNARHKALAHELLATLKQHPTYSHDPAMGSAPIAWRWIVHYPERFHRCVEAIETEFPQAEQPETDA